MLAPTLYIDTVKGTPQDSLSSESDFITLEIEGDEGLEAKDGATYQILYTSKATDNLWFVSGRIKGIPEGFIEAVEDNMLSSLSKVVVVPVILLGFMMWATNIVNRRHKRYYGKPLIPKYILWPMFMLTTACIIYIAYPVVSLTYSHSASIPQSLKP